MFKNYSDWTISIQARKGRFRDLKEAIEQHNKDIVQCYIEIYNTVTYAVGFNGQTFPCPRMCFAPLRGGIERNNVEMFSILIVFLLNFLI